MGTMHWAIPCEGDRLHAAWACRPGEPAPYTNNGPTPDAKLTATLNWRGVSCTEPACREAAAEAKAEQARQGLKHFTQVRVRR